MWCCRKGSTNKMATRKRRRRRNKVEKSAPKRISAALTRYLKRLNPSKMRGVTHVRVKRLKGGGATFTPVHGVVTRRRRRTTRRRRR